MLGTKANSPLFWWNKPLGKRSKIAFLICCLGGLTLFEALVPRSLLTVRGWQYLLAFILFLACGGILFGCLIFVATWQKRRMNLLGPDTLKVCLLLLSCLLMVWVTAFTEYKRVNPSFDSYASAVLCGFLVRMMNCASFEDQPPAE